MARKECPDNESVVRAIRSSDWDEKNDRWSSNLFRNQATSVSRPKVIKLSRLLLIFCDELHKPPAHRVIKTGEINIGFLKSLGKDYIETVVSGNLIE